MKGIFNKQNSFIKDIARKYVLAECCKLFNKTKGLKKVLSLPADNFIFEKALLDIYKNVNIIGIERNTDVYKKGIKLIKKQNIKIDYNNIEDTDYFLNFKSKFDVIWLDYCGPLTTNILTKLIPIVQGQHLTDDGILAITLLKGREFEMNKIEEAFGSNSIREDLFDILDIYAKWNNKSIEPINLLEYKDGSKGVSSTMLLYVMRIKNKNIKKIKHITKTIIKV